MTDMWHEVVVGGHDAPYVFLSLGGDGTQQLAGYDDSFLYQFDAYSNSYTPTRIMKLSGPELRDVTRDKRYRRFLVKQLNSMVTSATTNGDRDRPGYLAGWMAQEALLGNVSLARIQKASTNLATINQNPVLGQPWNPFCYVARSAWDSGLYGCPEGKGRNISFAAALAWHLYQTGYVTAQQAKGLGVDVVAMDVKRQRDTASYVAERETAWYIYNRAGLYARVMQPSFSPASVIIFDRSQGLEDDTAILQTDKDGRARAVLIERPTGNNLVDKIYLFRGHESCVAHATVVQHRLQQLQ